MNRVGYGAMQLAGPNVWGPPDDPESARRVLRLAVELGVTFFDTANGYGPRTVNRLIGERCGRDGPAPPSEVPL